MVAQDKLNDDNPADMMKNLVLVAKFELWLRLVGRTV
jgi:hypothetical protein